MARHRNVRRLDVTAASSHGRVVHESFSAQTSWSPAINVYERTDEFIVCVDLAGIDRKQIDVSVRPGRLTIRGERPAPEPPADLTTETQAQTEADPTRDAPPGEPDPATRIRLMEIDFGPFARDIALPDTLDLDRVTSVYRDGILAVHLPRTTPR
ncbi:MAG: Hsp20/alpha crystallin family protein [Planctomycetota bacterium]